MSSYSKDPIRVLKTAYKVGQEILPPYSHERSPQRFTQAQLFACLALKVFFNTDYRGISAMLESLSELRAAIDLPKTPHYTTLQKAGVRLLKKSSSRKLLQQTLDEFEELDSGKNPLGRRIAVDGTGLESRHVSRYYVTRNSAKKKK